MFNHAKVIRINICLDQIRVCEMLITRTLKGWVLNEEWVGKDKKHTQSLFIFTS